MKRLISLILASVVLLSVSMVALASEPAKSDKFVEAGEVYVEVIPHSMESGAGGPAGAIPATAEQIAEATKIETDIIQVSETLSTNSTTWTYLPGFTVYNQAGRYYCGPACVQAALNYINGSSPSQDTIAAGCYTDPYKGTSTDLILPYINKKQSRRVYVKSLNETEDVMKDQLSQAIEVNNAPAIIGLKFVVSDGWLYDTSGHFMSVYGAREDQTIYALGDPWIGYVDSGVNDYPWSYPKGADIIYTAYYAKGLGLLY